MDKEENDPGSHSLCIGSQADKEGKEELAEAGGMGDLLLISTSVALRYDCIAVAAADRCHSSQ